MQSKIQIQEETGFIPSIRAGIGDIVFAIIVKSEYTRNKINLILIFIISVFGRNVFDLIISSILSTDNKILNFIISILITVLIVLVWPYFELIIFKYKKELQQFTNHILDTYSDELYRIWRERLIIGLSCFLILFLLIVEVTSLWLIISILKFLCTYFILKKIDQYVEGKGWPGKIKSWIDLSYHKPNIIIYKHNNTIDENYYHPSITKKLISKKSIIKSPINKSLIIKSSNNIIDNNNNNINDIIKTENIKIDINDNIDIDKTNNIIKTENIKIDINDNISTDKNNNGDNKNIKMDNNDNKNIKIDNDYINVDENRNIKIDNNNKNIGIDSDYINIMKNNTIIYKDYNS